MLSLDVYCEAKGESLSDYKKSFITHRHQNIVQTLYRLYEIHKKKDLGWAMEVPRWSIVITDGSIEHGYAFTMGTTMYLPISYVNNVDESSLTNLLFHELRHIWQRNDYGRFIKTLDPVVWKGWNFKIMRDMTKSVQEMRSYSKDVIINPDSVQVLAYANRSEHPVYPVKENQRLVYIVRNHSQKIGWNDPHPCERDAREAAEKILSTE